MKQIILSFLALLCLTVTSARADNVTYYDPTDAVNPTKTAVNPTQFSKWPGNGELSAGWYYVSGSVNIPYRFAVIGTVNIILVDGCRFTASQGICVPEGSTLNIYAQKAGDGCGALTAYQEGKNAAIGGEGGNDASGNGPDIYDPYNYENTTPDAANAPEAGTITIYGGDITANGNIGGGDGGDGYPYDNRSGIGGKGGNGTIIIYDGHITVHDNLGGGKGGYGHGVEEQTGEDEEGNPEYNYVGGQGGNGGTGTITINGGYVNSEYMGGGYQGEGDNDGYGSFGAGNVSLSWSKASDMIYSQSYIGNVHLVKSFMDMHEVVYEGDYEDCQKGTIIQNKWLYPYSTMYDITIGGSYDPACLQSSKAHAMEGAEITLTAVNGYKLSSLTVKDAENHDVSLTDNLNGTWTFIMPAKAVTITPVATRFYQVNSSSNISHDVANANDKMVQNSKIYYRPGATVNLEVTVPDGYVIQSLTVKDEDDQNVSYSANGTNAYTFTMPTKAVTMEAVTMRDFSGLTLIEGTAAFTVTAGTDDGYGPFGPENLLDGKYSSTDASNYSLWFVDDIYNYGESSGCYVEFNTAAPVIPKHYTLISSNNPWESQGCYPTSWTIKAKASAGDEWTTIATESDNYTMDDEQAYHSYLFDFNNPGNNAYKYFRFEVTAVEGWTEWGDEWTPTVYHNWLELSEMQMYVKETEDLTANLAEGNYWTTYYNGTEGYRIVDENAYAYTAEYDNANSQLTLHKLGKVIPAGTAVIIVGADNSISMTASADAAENSVENDLHGVDARTQTSTLGTGTFYVMGKNNDKFGFFKYTAEYMPAHKAYLLVSGGAALAKGLTMTFDDDPTGIAPLLSPQGGTIHSSEGAWYTLDGRRINGKPTQKGIFIHNGRKEVMR